MITNTERFEFANLSELRDWLNRFEKTDLTVVFPADSAAIRLTWVEQTLTDGSKVTDVEIRT